MAPVVPTGPVAPVVPTGPVAPVSVEDPGAPVAPVEPVIPTEPVTPGVPEEPVGPVEPPPTGISREIIPVTGSIYMVLIACPTGKSIIAIILAFSITLNLETDLSVDKFLTELSFATLPKL